MDGRQGGGLGVSKPSDFWQKLGLSEPGERFGCTLQANEDGTITETDYGPPFTLQWSQLEPLVAYVASQTVDRNMPCIASSELPE
jgi:hypothetical protein